MHEVKTWYVLIVTLPYLSECINSNSPDRRNYPFFFNIGEGRNAYECILVHQFVLMMEQGC